LPTGLHERRSYLEIIRRLKELHERPLQLSVVQILGDLDRFFGEWVEAGVEHARRDIVRYRLKVQCAPEPAIKSPEKMCREAQFD
jgi:hypothetical protein